jgi:hypothetical protein
MSTELKKLIVELLGNRTKVELEVRLRYNKETGEIINYCHVNKAEHWTEDYIVISEDTLVYPIRQRVQDGKIVDIDTAVHVYWQAKPAITLKNNPYFCIKEIENAE